MARERSHASPVEDDLGCVPGIMRVRLGAVRFLLTRYPSGKMQVMSTLPEIEAAADALSSEEKEKLLRFLAMRLRKERASLAPRIYSEEELASMIAEDEADGERFRQGR